TRRRAPSPGAAAAALGRGDLLLRDGLGELRDQLAEVVAHALLLAADRLRDLGRLLVADERGQGLDREVRRDLLGLVLELRLGVLQKLFLLTGAAQHVQRTLRESGRAVGDVLRRLRRRGDGFRA